MNNIISPLLWEHLDAEDFNLLKFLIKDNKLNSARLLIERNMINLKEDDPKFIILNECYDQIINEIELTFTI